MKFFTIALVVIGLMAFASQSSAQDDRKLRNDPTYSTNNYKHPNKASTARRWENKAGVEVQQPTPGDANLANYKRQAPAQQPVGGITVEHTPSTDVADRNYKMQRPTVSNSPANTGVARKQPKQAENPTESGN